MEILFLILNIAQCKASYPKIATAKYTNHFFLLLLKFLFQSNSHKIFQSNSHKIFQVIYAINIVIFLQFCLQPINLVILCH